MKESHVIEGRKKIPVLYDVDVVIAGSSIAGTFAAIAAARGGARTLVIDRYGTLGGNIGPGIGIVHAQKVLIKASVENEI